jgi:hypothetical protein
MATQLVMPERPVSKFVEKRKMNVGKREKYSSLVVMRLALFILAATVFHKARPLVLERVDSDSSAKIAAWVSSTTFESKLWLEKVKSDGKAQMCSMSSASLEWLNEVSPDSLEPEKTGLEWVKNKTMPSTPPKPNENKSPWKRLTSIFRKIRRRKTADQL